MTTDLQSTRRDIRYEIRRGRASVGIVPVPEAPVEVSGVLKNISVAGLEFRVERGVPALRPDGPPVAAQVRVGDCVLEGTVVVRSVVPDHGGVEVGCLFYPVDEPTEARLMALIAGLHAAGPS